MLIARHVSSVPLCLAQMLSVHPALAAGTLASPVHSCESAHSVISESELQHGIGLAAADIGPLIRWNGIDHDRPREGNSGHKYRCCGQHRQFLFPSALKSEEIKEINSRYDHIGFQHLHVEADTDHGKCAQNPGNLLPSHSFEQHPGGQKQGKHQHAVNIIAPADRCRDRCAGHDQAGEPGRCFSE